jgi:rhomboid protease GluP
MALGAAWVAVFVLMLADQAWQSGGLSPWQVILGLRNGHRFGDVRLVDIFGGASWRVLTATFVHYGLLHIALNLYALYQLGALVESWYGSGPFVAIYVLTGGGGNLLSGLIRRAIHEYPFMPCAGGSTVIMGLVALAALVGWNSRTRVGTHLSRLMLICLGLTAGLGAASSILGPLLRLPVMVDNWGHAGGAIVGAALGLAHHGILRRVGARLAGLSGWIGTAAILASTAALLVDDRDELMRRQGLFQQARQRLERDSYAILQLDKVRSTYRAVAIPRAMRRGFAIRVQPIPASVRPSATEPSNAKEVRAEAKATTQPAIRLDPASEFDLNVLNASLRLLDSMRPVLEIGPGSADYARGRTLLVQTLIEPPTPEEVREFDDRMAALQTWLRADREAAQVQALSLSRGLPAARRAVR